MLKKLDAEGCFYLEHKKIAKMTGISVHYQKQAMEKRFPGANRSYIKLKDSAVCGGDVNAIRLDKINYENPMWRKLVDTRKNVLKQAALLGFDTLFLILLRALTLAQTEARVCNKLGIAGRLLISPYAEIAMDVDKPHQFEILNQDLRLQNGNLN